MADIRKKCLFGMLCAAVLCLLCACSGIKLREAPSFLRRTESGSADSADTEPTEDVLYLGMMLKDLDNPYFLRVKAGAEDAADELGAAVMVVAPDNERNRKEQKAMLEALADMDIDVLAVALTEEENVADELKRAHDNGKLIMAVDTPLNSKYCACYVGTHPYNAGYKAGLYAAEQCGGNGHALILRGSSADLTHELREEGLVCGLRSGGVLAADTIADDRSTEDFWEDLRGMLLAHPDINVICATKDSYAIAAEEITGELGLDIPIVSFDGMEEVTADILAGTISASLAQDPYLIGRRCVQIAEALYRGEPPTGNIYIGTELITADNAAAYAAALQTADTE